jgi:hypothetical protein
MTTVSLGRVFPSPSLKLCAELAFLLGLQCAMLSQAAAETWAIDVVQLNPEPRDPALRGRRATAAVFGRHGPVLV